MKSKQVRLKNRRVRMYELTNNNLGIEFVKLLSETEQPPENGIEINKNICTTRINLSKDAASALYVLLREFLINQ